MIVCISFFNEFLLIEVILPQLIAVVNYNILSFLFISFFSPMNLLHKVENILVIYFINNLTDINFKNTHSRYRISCRTERCLVTLKLQFIIEQVH